MICSFGPLPDAGAATTVRTLSWGGWSATAAFGSSDGCNQLSGQVWAFDAFEHQNRGGTTHGLLAYVAIARTDTCNGTDSSSFGVVNLDRGDFKVRGDLGVASLHASVDLVPLGSEAAVPVDIDLTWHATADPLRAGDHFVAHNSDGSMEISHGLGNFRGAVATGTISDGAVDYTGGTESFGGSIGYGRDGVVLTSKG